MPIVADGKLKAIAIGSAKRLRAAPNVPTISETLPGYEANASWNYFAPKGFPPDIALKLNREINRILELPEVGGRLEEQGLIPARRLAGGSAGAHAERLRKNGAAWFARSG